MDQPQPSKPTAETPAAQPIASTPTTGGPSNPPTTEVPYRTGDGSYNRESGKKTLAFVGVIIALIAVLSVSSLLMINRKSSVMVQSEQNQQTQTVPSTAPTATPTPATATSSEEAELDMIDVETIEDTQSLEEDANQL